MMFGWVRANKYDNKIEWVILYNNAWRQTKITPTTLMDIKEEKNYCDIC